MNNEVYQSLQESIIKHEGYSEIPYKDSKGIWTIWYGHNLMVNSKESAKEALQIDIANAARFSVTYIPLLSSLDEIRQSVLIEMVFNMGIEKVLEFKLMLCALQSHDYKKASECMLDSLWAEQVGQRAKDMAKVMEIGSYI